MASKFQIEVGEIAETHSLVPVPRTADSVPYIELRQSLPSQIVAISPFVNELMRFVLNFRNADGSEMEIEIAVREALANAVIHGNCESAQERVHVTCRCHVDGEVIVTVRDEGQGFEITAVPDPTAPENQLFTHGRGIFLMKMLMDEVRFERDGATVCMRKKATQRRLQ